MAGLAVNLDLGHVRGVGPRGARHGVGGVDINLLLFLFAGEGEEVDFQVGAFDAELRIGKAQVLDSHFQLFGRQRFRQFNGFFSTHLQRRTACEQRTRTGAAKTVDAIRVAHQDAYLVDVHAKGIDHELRQRRADALAHRVHSGHHVDKAVGFDGDGDAFFQRIAARPLQKGGDTQATHLAFGFGLRGACLKTAPVSQRQHLVHHMFKTATVVDLAHRVGVGHLLGLDEVAPTQLDAVNAGLACSFIHQAFDIVDRLGAARTTVRASGRGVGQHRLEVVVNHPDVIHAGLHPGANHQLNRHTRAGGVGTDVGH